MCVECLLMPVSVSCSWDYKDWWGMQSFLRYLHKNWECAKCFEDSEQETGTSASWTGREVLGHEVLCRCGYELFIQSRRAFMPGLEHEQSHRVGGFVTCLGTGWFGYIGESSVVRRWKGRLGPDGRWVKWLDLWCNENPGTSEGEGCDRAGIRCRHTW